MGSRRGRGRLRAALSDFGWALREHLIWRPAYALRRGGEMLKWPFERLAWAVRECVWRIQDRTDLWAPATRGLAVATIVLAAAAAGVSGMLLAAPEHEGETATLAAAPAPEPTVEAAEPVATPQPQAEPEPTLKGATPVFAPAEPEEPAGASSSDSKNSSKPDAKTGGAAVSASAGGPAPLPTVLSSSGSKGATASASASGEVAGPKALKVAREFAKAFVLYETGRGDREVRQTFGETASQELSRALLRRPPRQPANVEVPKAKVLNVVPGPSQGGVYTVSVSLLRVGLTSELRLDMERGKGKRWQVTDVLG